MRDLSLEPRCLAVAQVPHRVRFGREFASGLKRVRASPRPRTLKQLTLHRTAPPAGAFREVLLGKLIVKKAIETGLGALCVLAAASAPTFAADMYRAPDVSLKRSRRLRIGPAYAGVNWTGLYAGLNARGAWSSNSVALNGHGGSAWAPYYPDPFHTRTLDGSGFIGGAQIGYNRQFDSIVAGIEAGISGLSGGANLNESGLSGIGSPYTLNLSEKLDWLATVRGRLGFAAGSGPCYTQLAVWQSAVFQPPASWTSPTAPITTPSSETKVGWVLAEAWSMHSRPIGH